MEDRSLTARQHLRQELLASLICLELVDVLHQDPLVLEHVALDLQVQAVIPTGTERTVRGCPGIKPQRLPGASRPSRRALSREDFFSSASSTPRSWPQSCVQQGRHRSARGCAPHDPKLGAGAAGLHVAVDLLGLPVSAEQAPQDPHSPHPGHLLGHTSVGRTLPLT